MLKNLARALGLIKTECGKETERDFYEVHRLLIVKESLKHFQVKTPSLTGSFSTAKCKKRHVVKYLCMCWIIPGIKMQRSGWWIQLYLWL